MNVYDSGFRRWIYLILILAAVLRFGFLMSGDVLPVMWDARRYVSAAVALLSYVDTSGPETAQDDRVDRYAFKHYYEKYIQGEKIDWQYYTPHSLTQARDDLFFSGPLYPSMLAAIFYLAPAADFTFARILGIIFDLLSVWLILLVALRLVGRRAAIVSGLLYALYFPFIQTSTMLLLETSTNFFLLLGIFLLMRGVETERRRYLIATGIICGLLVMHKPTAMLLIGPLVLGFYFYTRDDSSTRQFLKRLMLIALPAGIMFCSWLTVASFKYDQLALRDPSYARANLRQSSSIAYEGYDLDIVEEDFNSRPIYGDLFGQASGYAGLFAKKFERLWSRPYNDFKRTFLLPNVAVEWLHTFMIVFGFIGMIMLMFRSRPQAGWPVAICAYYTAIHLVFHSINRYSFNALPMVIICAAGCSVLLYDSLTSGAKRSRVMVIVGLALLSIGTVIQPTWMAVLFGSGLSLGIVIATLILKTLLWLVALFALGTVLLSTRRHWQRYLFTASVCAVFVIFSWTPLLSRDGWAEFSCRLESPDATVGRRIYMTGLSDDQVNQRWALFIDMNVPEGESPVFSVTIGDSKNSYILGREPLRRHFYPKPTYTEYARFEKRGIESFRQYAIITLPGGIVQHLVQQFGYVDISLQLSSRPGENIGLNIYGSHGGPGYIPSFWFTSIERYVHRGDPRIREAVNFVSDSSVSYYIASDEARMTQEDDLSDAPGRQTGGYHIFLEQLDRDGGVLIY